MTTTNEKRVFIEYRREDFLLYVLALVSVGALCAGAWAAFDDPLPWLTGRAAWWPEAWRMIHTACTWGLVAALAYLAGTFVLRRGAAFDPTFASTFAVGAVRYVVDLIGLSWLTRKRLLRLLAIFLLAVVLERLFEEHLPELLRARFPWQLVMLVEFVLPTAYRTRMLFGHWAHADHIANVLDQSPLRRWMRRHDRMSMRNHVVHAWVTGIVTHVCTLAPCALFYAATEPTVFREAVMCAISSLGFTRWGNYLLRERMMFLNTFYKDHSTAHTSRFYFTVIHGQHHDTIPSGLAAVSGAAFLESSARSVWDGFMLNSIVLRTVLNTFFVFRGMLNHQFIPGVFPYSRFVIAIRQHHVLHHYGMLYPVGQFAKILPNARFFFAHEEDLKKGYRTDNAKIRWYLDLVAKYEPGAVSDGDREAWLQGPTTIVLGNGGIGRPDDFRPSVPS